MYRHVLAVLAAFAASPAAASSVQLWSTIPIANPPSIIDMTCSACSPATASVKPDAAAVPSLAQGEQRLSVIDRNGKPALMRTEAWMGGSPVTFVSINPVWVETEQGVIAGRNAPPTRGDGVDLQAKTSAVGANVATDDPAHAEPAVVMPLADPQASNFSAFELRPSR